MSSGTTTTTTVAAAATSRAVPTSSFTMSDMGTIHEDAEAVEDFSIHNSTNTKKGTGRPRIPRTPHPNGGIVSSARSMDSVPMGLNRPRKLSNSSSATASSIRSKDSAGGFTRSSSWSSNTSFDSMDSVGWRHEARSKYSFQDSASTTSSTTTTSTSRWANADEMFSTLPPDVLENVLGKLKMSHLGARNEGCATCWMRDLCSISVCNHRWSTLARLALYEDIQLVGADSATHKKRFKLAEGSRVLMLRHTLRANPHLAAIVRSLKLPRPDLSNQQATNVKNSLSVDQYEDLVASLVMACPNLETLAGPIRNYNHQFNRIHYALSTRSQLKKIHWVMEAPELPKLDKPSKKSKSSRSDVAVMPSTAETLLQQQKQQQETFRELHDRWVGLEQMVVHQLPTPTPAPDALFVHPFNEQFPSLKHLHLHNISAAAFNDTHLLSLPALTSLTLSHISGITANGLSSFSAGPSSRTLRKLQLRHTPMNELQALARVLSNLSVLTTFSLVQAYPPLIPEAKEDGTFTLFMMPFLASPTVQKIHWDITSHTNCLSGADDFLSRSIAADGFPALRILRTPNDPEGVFQNLCRPRPRVDLPHDKFHNPLINRASTEPAASPKSPMRRLRRTPSDMALASPVSLPDVEQPQSHTNLCAARLAAQARIEMSWSRPRWEVNVFEEDGTLVETFGIGAFIGTVGSLIHYQLTSDEDSTDEKGGLVDVPDLGADGGEVLRGGNVGCTGSWNDEGVVADKKEKERWWHVERGRWMAVEM